MDEKWKQKEINSWRSLLSNRKIFTRELNKPYSYGILWTFLYRKNFGIILKMIGVIKNRRILEIGCGSGWLIEWIAKAGGILIGVDISSEYCKISKIRAQQRKFEADFICADGENLPFKDNTFDSAVTYESLHHFPCPNIGIQEALRVSRSLVLGNEPAKIPLSMRAFKVFKRIIYARMNVGEVSGIREIRFNPEELESMYLSKGYIVRFEKVWSFVPTFFWKLEKLKVVRDIYRTSYFFLMNAKALKNLGHGFIMVIQRGKQHTIRKILENGVHSELNSTILPTTTHGYYKVKEKWNNNLCTGCGTCAGICPNDVIKMCKYLEKGIYVPMVTNLEKCKKCGLCIKVCPGRSLDLEELNLFVFGKTLDDVLLGSYINCYIGHATDEKIRRDASSGGLVTSLLIFALEEGVIDGAIVTRMRKDKCLEPEVIIARTEEEVVSASKSKYCPVPVNVAMKDVLNQNGRFAVVGLPCHIQGIRKAERLNKKLKDKIALHIGLFCSHTVNFLGTKFLLQRMDIRVEDVIKIDYRGRGWPGGMTVRLRDRSERILPLFQYWNNFFAPFFFTPMRCTLCSDGTNELADISLGDAWLPELMDCTSGESMVITRSEIGERILQEAAFKKRIAFTKVNRNKIIQAQRDQLLFKKKNLKARILILQSLGKQTPESNSKLPKPSPVACLSTIVTYLGICMSSKHSLRRLLIYVPLPLLKLYSVCVNAANKL